MRHRLPQAHEPDTELAASRTSKWALWVSNDSRPGRVRRFNGAPVTDHSLRPRDMGCAGAVDALAALKAMGLELRQLVD